MPGPKDLDYLDCSVANTLDVIGDRWNILLLRDAFMGVRRFEDFQKDLGIARNILSNRLNRLVDAGIFETIPYQDNPPRSEYRLTPAGKDLLDVLLALWRWGDRWNAPQDAALRELVHLDCGEATHSVATCANCGGELQRSNLRIIPGLEIMEDKREGAGARA